MGDSNERSMLNGLTEGATLGATAKQDVPVLDSKDTLRIIHHMRMKSIIHCQILFPVNVVDGQFPHLPVIGHLGHGQIREIDGIAYLAVGAE